MDALKNGMENNKLYKSSLENIVNYVEESGKSFLVTGASGLIGSCIVDLLMLANKKGKNNQIYALSRNSKKMEIKFREYLNSNCLHIIEQDICSPLDDSLEFDYIIHCASNADPVNYARYPVETMKTNLLGGINILDYLKKHKKCKAELLSTFEVYGDLGKDFYSEQEVGFLNFNLIRACYPESKRVMETLARSYVDEYDVRIIIGRLPSVYGPTMAHDDSKAHAQFIRNAIAGKDIVLKSKGEQRRTYCYVLDAVAAILCVLFRGKNGEVYNISNEKSILSIAELAQIIAGVAGRNVVFDIPTELEKKGFSKPQNCMLDNTKLKALGWEGKYDILKGITECMAILAWKNDG